MVNTNNTPRIIYKYCSPAGLGILRDLRIKVTPPRELNDPFEFNFRISGKYPPDKLFQLLSDPRERPSLVELFSTNGISFDDFLDYLRIDPSAVARLADNPEMLKSEDQILRVDFIDQMNRELGVVCMSEVSDSILMWSHYAKSHTGIVIAFLASSNNFKHCFPVEYGKERAPVIRGLLAGDPGFKEQVDLIARRKSSDWAYEREWRSLHLLNECIFGRLGDRDAWFYPIEAQTIHSVVLGCRCTNLTKTKIAELLKRRDLSHIHLREATIHADKFELDLSCRSS